jgi:branched-chain amino acid transport system permease protein
MTLWMSEIPPRGRWLLAALLVVLLAAPFVVSSYVLSVLILVLYFAYLGQAWNIMMGFAGLLSLGHALYFGLGAYASAALYAKFGISPWLGMVLGAALAAVAGAVIGALGFRFRIGGVYFALLTIAFAEFTRILFDHIDWVGGTAGFFLPGLENRSGNDLWTLRGDPEMFYYIWLGGAVGVLLLCRRLLSSRLGYFWLAIREDEVAAQALGIDIFRYKILAVMLSAALTACGGVVYAFYYNTLFPEPIFSIGRSIEMLLGAITGGVGTLMGPIIGAFILTPLGETLTVALEPLQGAMKLDGMKQVFYGLCVILIVVFQRHGVWPYLARRLGIAKSGAAK